MDVDGDLCFIDYPARINEWHRERGISSAGSQPAQKTVNFTPRLTAPSTTDKYWRHTSKGGLTDYEMITDSDGYLLYDIFKLKKAV